MIMEDKDLIKIRKDKIKNVTIVFLAIMLALTFFSNSILNFSLPEVATENIHGDSITEKVRGTGTVTANDPFKVVVKESRVIESVGVKKGDEVEKDQVLFYLEDKDSDELIKAEAELEALSFAFAQKILSGDISATSFTNAKNGTEFSIAQYQAKIQAANDKVTAAQNAVYTLTNEANAIQKRIDLLSNKVVDTSDEQNAYDNANKNLAEANRRLEEANIDVTYYDDIVNTLSGSATTFEDAVATLEASIATCEAAVAAKQADLTTIETDNSASEDDKAIAQEALNQATAVLNKKQGELNALRDAQAKLTEAKDRQWNLQKKVAECNETLSNAKANLDKVTAATGDKSDKVALENQLIEVKAKLTTAGADLEKAKTEQANAVKDVQTELDLGNQNSLIADKQKEVDKLRENSVGATITSPVAGIVTEISKSAGESTVPEEELAVIQVAGKGFTVSISVTNEQAKKVKIGDMADLQNAWYYGDVKAVLTKIQPDTQDPGKKKLLVFNLEGSIQDGETLSLSIGQRSNDYDMVVPNSAIREDKNGKFILIIEEKSTPFGNRYKAKKVEVEVLASDDKQTAINAALEGYEYVITTSNKPVEPGKQVRLSDN